VVVHVEYALLADAAVVSALWFENMAYDAIDLPFVLGVVHEEALSG